MVRRVLNKSLNPGRLQEELVGLPLDGSISWPGYRHISDRVVEVRTERVLLRSGSINGTRFEEYCGPVGGGDTYEFGEVQFGTTRDLTAAEVVDLDARLALHNSATLSAEQVRQDQDETDLTTLIASERQIFIDAIQTLTGIVDTWDGLTTAQRQTATKQGFTACRDALRTVGKVMRVFLRRERNAAI